MYFYRNRKVQAEVMRIFKLRDARDTQNLPVRRRTNEATNENKLSVQNKENFMSLSPSPDPSADTSTRSSFSSSSTTATLTRISGLST